MNNKDVKYALIYIVIAVEMSFLTMEQFLKLKN